MGSRVHSLDDTILERHGYALLRQDDKPQIYVLADSRKGRNVLDIASYLSIRVDVLVADGPTLGGLDSVKSNVVHNERS
ncbi:hypothetical protein HY641_04715 [Candidatus Woesearchaeota archaeon]|nr:hypothetical protein [Candidatus Woesearchaeota archaeon]